MRPAVLQSTDSPFAAAAAITAVCFQAMHQLPPQLPPLGTKLLLQPGHCDPTVNMYDSIVAVREGRVVAVWPVAGRGPGL
jgi:D-serine deaminase-like pyridoxal phosphate-dependent protein